MEAETCTLPISLPGFIDDERLYALGISERREWIVDVFKRVARISREVEEKLNSSERAKAFESELTRMLRERKLIPSTTILMNAGRVIDAPLSACTVPKVDLKNDLSLVKTIVDKYHIDGMGTGFNFDEIEDPIPIIEYLNGIWAEWQRSGNQLRPVWNMWVLSIDHPKLLEFINVKNQKLWEQWVFNFSVLVSDNDIDAMRKWLPIKTRDGKEVSSDMLLHEISRSIHRSGEPWLIFMDRLNSDNQVPSVGEYKSLAPCWEVGLVEGETCQFSYVNLWVFFKNGSIDYEELWRCVEIAVRFLDNAVEYNVSRFSNALNREIAEKKRRIGLWVCWFADLLDSLGLEYWSEEARKIAENLLSFINFVSKKTSVKLARERWAFGAFAQSKYQEDESLVRKLALRPTDKVSSEEWLELDRVIRENGIRNCSTIAIPPTGRSSYIVWASPAIEPHFSKALETKPDDQLLMVSAIQKFTDDSISKTLNVHNGTSVDEICRLLRFAVDLNLKGITLYRDGSRSSQPEKI